MMGKDFCKVAPDALYNANQTLQRWQDNICRRLLIENYADGRVEIHIHYPIRGGDGHLHDYCAIMKAAGGKIVMDMWTRAVTPRRIFDLPSFDNPKEWQEKLMLVSYVAFVDEDKGIIRVPSTLARLHPLKHCCHVLPKPVL